VIQEDRELLAELARLNSDMAALAKASTAEQQHYAQHLISAGERLHRRAAVTTGSIIEGEIVTSHPPRFPVRLA
jgi:hypothetical protein